MQARIGELRTKIQLSVGQVILAVMNLPRYRNQSLADLAHLFLNPLLRDRLAIAHKVVKVKDGTAPDAKWASEGAGKKVDEETIAGLAIWATVSDAVDAKITEQIRTGAFPVRLGPDDWVSGDHVWRCDVVAGDRKQATLRARQLPPARRRAAGEDPPAGRAVDRSGGAGEAAGGCRECGVSGAEGTGLNCTLTS